MPGKKGGTGEEGIKKERRGGKKSKNTPLCQFLPTPLSKYSQRMHAVFCAE